MKKILFISFVLLSNIIFSLTVKIGFFEGYPTNFIDIHSGNVTGHTIEYLKDFVREIGYEPEFVGPLPFPRLLDMLKKGEIDALLGMSWVKEREEFVYYPDKPYRISIPNIFVLKSSNINQKLSIDSLKNYLFSYRSGATLPDYLREFETLLDIEYLSRDTWIDQSLQLLEMGRIDGIINSSDLSIIAASKRLGIYSKIKQINLPGKNDPLYLGISKKSKIAKDFLNKYNMNIRASKLNIMDYDALEF